MEFELYACSGKISIGYDYSNMSPKQRPANPGAPAHFLELLGCDIQEARGRVGTAVADIYSYVVYFPMSDDAGLGLVRFKGQDMTMAEYLERDDKIDIKEGFLFSGLVNGKTVNGKIVFYMPNQLGCKIGIIDVDV